MDKSLYKIVYINCGNPITDTIRHLFSMDAMEEVGFQVEYWGLSSYFYPDLHTPNELDTPNHIRFDNLKDFEEQLKLQNRKNTIVVVAFDLYYPYREAFSLLNKSGLYIVRIFPYAGISEFKYSFKERAKRIIHSNLIQKFKRNFQQKTYSFFFRNFINSNLIKEVYSSALPRTKAINHPDYENYLKLQKEKNRLIEKPYFVFLDVYFPLHHDLRTVHHLENIEAEAYYQSMRAFFDKIEAIYHKPVVIAAHPKADYQGKEFGNRKVVKYQTDNLVKFSDGVISHYSNSIAYALLFNKPIALVANQMMMNTPTLEVILTTYAKKFNRKIFIVDADDFSTLDFSPIEETSRKKYIYSYLTTKETETFSNKEILKEEFKRMFNLISNQ